jgi:hypothetical protein
LLLCLGTVGNSFHKFKDQAFVGNLLFESRRNPGVNPHNYTNSEYKSYKKNYLAIESYMSIISPIIAGVMVDKGHLNIVVAVFPIFMFIGAII